MSDEGKLHRGWYHPRSLPHFDSPERVQFVTFRLADSLPRYLAIGDETAKQLRRKFEEELDIGRGNCWLGRPEIAALVEDTLLAFHDERYRLWAWCIMPNHVHCLFEPSVGNPLADIVKSWKVYSTMKVNKVLNRSGVFWQRDYFDRYMRDETQMANAVYYIEQNPVKARLCQEAHEWRWSSAWRKKDGVSTF